MGRLRALWRNLRYRADVDRELDAEIQSTIDLLAEEHRTSGMPPEAARRAAIHAVGGIEAVKTDVRRARTGVFLDAIWQDACYAMRTWRRQPLFAATAALSLAIGIGATTAMFTIANGLLFRPPPGVADPDGLVDVVRTELGATRAGLYPISYVEYEAIRDRSMLIDSVYGFELQPEPVSLVMADGAERAFAGVVTLNYFHALGVPTAAGRVFGAVDGEPPATDQVAVLSYRYWLRRFQGDPAVPGRTIRLNGRTFTVVGVVSPEFHGTGVLAPDLWIPVSTLSRAGVSGQRPGDEVTAALMLGGRLKAGISRSQATAEIGAISSRLAEERPRSRQEFVPLPGARDQQLAWRWSVERSSTIPFNLRLLVGAFLGILTALVSLILVLACTNLAGVLLARAVARRREIGIRAAMGAGRRRIVGQLLIETVSLFVAGGVVAMLLSRVLVALLLLLLPATPFPVNLQVPFDARVAVFTLVVAFVAALLCGVAPAWHAAKTDVLSALNNDAERPARLRMRRVFVATQVALSLLLVIVAGLLWQTMFRLGTLNRGFDSHDVVIATLDVGMAGEDAQAAARLADRVLPRMKQRPEVTLASVADRTPDGRSRRMELRAQDGGPAVPAVLPNLNMVGPAYFSTLRIPVLEGREFTPGDRAESEPVVIVDRRTSRRLWPDQNAIGQRISLPVPGTSSTRERVVVGVVGDAPSPGTSADTPFTVFLPFQQVPTTALTLIVRTADSKETIAALRGLTTEIAPSLPLLALQTLDSQLDGPVETQVRIAAAVAGCAGGVGMLLAAIGIYGITAFFVSQRTREIGIRLALGARPADIVGLIVKQGMTLVAAGAVIGLTLALGAGRLLAVSELRTSAFDFTLSAAALALFVTIGLIACQGPARRAMRLNPVTLLKIDA